ncbi:MAG TPA: hypothetical protein PL104_02685 [Caldisericia bacterium]|nr:hypothetical protein [Caldisericia bacterium]
MDCGKGNMSENYEVKIEGIEELQRNLKNLAKKNVETAKKAMTDIGYDLLMKSRAIVPIDKGILAQDSDAGFISETELIVTYGMGMARDYAVIQHERLDFQHAPGREAKYLEKPFRENIQNYISTLAEKLKGVMR